MAHHGTGAGITVNSTAHTTAATGIAGDITIHGAAMATMGTATLGTTADSTIHGTMTHGTTAAIGAATTEVTMPDISDGTTHGTTTTTAGITLTTEDLHTLWEDRTTNRAITYLEPILKEDRLQPAILQDRQCAHQAEHSEAA